MVPADSSLSGARRCRWNRDPQRCPMALHSIQQALLLYLIIHSRYKTVCKGATKFPLSAHIASSKTLESVEALRYQYDPEMLYVTPSFPCQILLYLADCFPCTNAVCFCVRRWFKHFQDTAQSYDNRDGRNNRRSQPPTALLPQQDHDQDQQQPQQPEYVG